VVAFTLCLLMASIPIPSVSASSAIGVHVGEKLLYGVASQSPLKYESLVLLTVTGILTGTGSPYPTGDTIITFSASQMFANGTVVNWICQRGQTNIWEDISAGGNNALCGFGVMPTNIPAGPFQWGGGTLNVQTKHMFGSVVDYTTVTLQPAPGVTWTAFMEWFQSTGVGIYWDYDMPGFSVSNQVLLWQS
jgi:hypothetical protein